MGNSTSTLTKQIQDDAAEHGVINFSCLHLDSIPPFIKYKIDFSRITVFEAENNSLTSIPTEINQLVNLIDINFAKNNISRIFTPTLSQLRKFDVSFNPLVELPEDLDVAPKLELISCYACRLRKLPIDCMQRMPNLSIMVNSNYLSIGYDQIPREIISSGNLQGINDQHVPSEIIENFLYLGSYSAAKNWEELQRLQIRHVICMVSMIQLPFVGRVTYHTIKIDDIETADIKQHFESANNFINSAKDAGGRVLVHCAAGVSRSASVVIAYLMMTRRMAYEEAKDFVSQRRPCICPNDGFEKQLIEYGESLQSKPISCSISES